MKSEIFKKSHAKTRAHKENFPQDNYRVMFIFFLKETIKESKSIDSFVLPVKNVLPKLSQEEPLMESMREFEEIMRKKKAKSFRFFEEKGNEEIEFVPGIYKFDESYISRRANKISSDSTDEKGFVYVEATFPTDLVEFVDGTKIFRLVKKY